jgi:hypothetical protein
MADITGPQMSRRPGALSGARRETNAGVLMIFGAIGMLVGVVLPWGTGGEGFVVSGLTGDLGIYTLAIVIAAALSIALAVMAFRGAVVKASSRALGVLATVFCGFLCVLLPAGIVIAAGLGQGSPTAPGGTVTMGLGAWLIAVGVVAIATGVMLYCARGRRMRLALLVIPVLFVLLFAYELR